MGPKAWENVLQMPLPGRSMKPRTKGFTMVLDKGLGCRATEDLMATAGDYIDFLKLSFGTSALYDEDVLCEKLDIVRNAGVDVYPGGTLLEVVVCQNSYGEFLRRAKELGFTSIEVSDGTMHMVDEERADCIKRALDAGFQVLTEVGKKSPEEKLIVPEMHRQIARDLELGAMLAIIEAREGGKGIGIYDKSGAVDKGELNALVSGIEDLDRVMWEAPLKSQQEYLILCFGSNVNLGNIPTGDALALETLRQGLRGDTLKWALGSRNATC